MNESKQTRSAAPAQRESSQVERGAVRTEGAFFDRRESTSSLTQLATIMNAGAGVTAQRQTANWIHQSPKMQAFGTQVAPVHSVRNDGTKPLQAKSGNGATVQRQAVEARPHNTVSPDNLQSGVQLPPAISVQKKNRPGGNAGLFGLGCVQRIVAPVAGGLGLEYTVTPADLNTGTTTTQGSRNYVQNLATPMPPAVNYQWDVAGPVPVGPQVGAVPNPANATMVGAYPAIAGLRADAGHRLARQNGGDGANDVFPQNSPINRGWVSHALWRGEEQRFHNAVNAHALNVGTWSVDV